jgi:hypothetical protein
MDNLPDSALPLHQNGSVPHLPPRLVHLKPSHDGDGIEVGNIVPDFFLIDIARMQQSPLNYLADSIR